MHNIKFQDEAYSVLLSTKPSRRKEKAQIPGNDDIECEDQYDR